MLEPLESEPFRTYALIALGSIVGGSHGIIYLLSIVGLLLRPFWRQPVAFLYPWVGLSFETHGDITKTSFSFSSLLLIHMLWLTSSVGLWVGLSLYFSVLALNELFPGVVGLEVIMQHGLRVPAWMVSTVLAMYAGVFASVSSLMWLGSLRRFLTNFRRMNSARDGEVIDDAGHYFSPFRKATAWAFATLPIYIGLVVVVVIIAPPFQG